MGSLDKDPPVIWENITKLKGPTRRHLEQLWDEIVKLKEEVIILKKKISQKDSQDDSDGMDQMDTR